jgi:hypothetical protein
MLVLLFDLYTLLSGPAGHHYLAVPRKRPGAIRSIGAISVGGGSSLETQYIGCYENNSILGHPATWPQYV